MAIAGDFMSASLIVPLGLGGHFFLKEPGYSKKVVRKWESRKESLINASFGFIMVATLSALCLLVVAPYDS